MSLGRISLSTHSMVTMSPLGTFHNNIIHNHYITTGSYDVMRRHQLVVRVYEKNSRWFEYGTRNGVAKNIMSHWTHVASLRKK